MEKVYGTVGTSWSEDGRLARNYRHVVRCMHVWITCRVFEYLAIGTSPPSTLQLFTTEDFENGNYEALGLDFEDEDSDGGIG